MHDADALGEAFETLLRDEIADNRRRDGHDEQVTAARALIRSSAVGGHPEGRAAVVPAVTHVADYDGEYPFGINDVAYRSDDDLISLLPHLSQAIGRHVALIGRRGLSDSPPDARAEVAVRITPGRVGYRFRFTGA